MENINGIMSDAPQTGMLDPRVLALLQAGLTGMQASGPQRQPTSLGQIMGQAGQAGLGAYQQGMVQQRQMAQLAQQKQLQDAQIRKTLADAKNDELKAQNDEAERSYFASPSVQAKIAAGDITGAMAGSPKPNVNLMATLADKKMANQANVDARNFAVTTMDQGRRDINADNDRRARDLATQRAADKKESDERLAASNFERDRIRAADKQDLQSMIISGKQEQRPRLGIDQRFNANGDVEIIPGSVTYRKQQAKLVAARSSTDSVVQNLDKLTDAISDLETDPGLPNITGTFAGRTWNVTNTATGAQNKLDSIKSQIFQSSLQAMRAASKTGGAVGNVSDKEGDKLERTIAALNQSAGTPAFKDQLKKAREQLAISKAIIQNAFEEEFGSQQLQLPRPAGVPSGGSNPTQARSFASVEDAEKAMLPKGTKIIINGRSATVQ